ncbi:cyclic nucleotide-binding-like protein [Chytriomyces sp. MP71]|nr:cyclic nucleotide-binding-like protein [Chytriomyces sp. MP71]
MNRTATVLAKTACTLAVITKQKLDEIIATDPEIRARVNDFSASKEAWWKEQQYVESQEKFGAEFANEIGRKEIKKIDLFSKTSNAVLDQLAMKMKSVVFTKNYLIISTGQESDAMYFILSGSVEVVGPTGDVHAEMTAGSFFGEVGLLMNMQRTASVRAKQECLIFKLWKSDLDFVLGEHEEIQTAIKKAVDERYELYKKRTTPLLATKSIDQIPDQFDMEVGVQALRKISIFRNIDKSFLQELSMALTRKNWNKGDMIITAEQYGDSMYFLAAGQVEVMTSFGEVIDNVSGPSAYFGEVAVIEAIPRTASVKCVSQCSTYELKRADLQLVVKQYPDIAEHVRATAEARLQQHLMRNVLA